MSPFRTSSRPGFEPPPAPYAARRAELRKELKDGVIVLFGGSETDDLHTGFFQEPNFYYLTGWNQPGAVLVIDPARDVLFLPAKNPDAEKWTGVKASGRGVSLSRLAYEALTRPKSFHLRTDW